MNAGTAPSPDLDQTLEFLRRLPAAEAEHLALIPISGRIGCRSFGRANLWDAIGWLASAQGSSNCYYHANPLKPGVRNRKAKRQDVLECRLLHVDIDDLGAADRIEAFPLKPSVVVMSGGGYQALWFLAEPCRDLDRVEALNKRLAQLLKGDSCFSADHLLRLPGTLNTPNEKKRGKGRTTVLARIVPELTDYERTYTLTDAEAVIGPSPSTRPAGALGTLLAGEEADPAPVLARLNDYVLELIKEGDDVERPIGTTDATYPSRSEVVFRVSCELARAGANEATIVAILVDPNNGISASIREKTNPAAYARRQAEQAFRAVSDGWPTVNRSGQPTGSFPNALTALLRLDLRFEYDEFRHEKRVNGLAIRDFSGEVSDEVIAALRAEVLRRWRFDPGKEHVRDAAHTLCIWNKVHPLRDFLNKLEWDGQPRVERWMTAYLGAEDTPLHRAVGELVLVAAVRRVRVPGTKFDTVPILEGPQGSGKSSAIAILAGLENYSDQEILTLDPKTQLEAMKGVWLYELSELQGINRAEVERVKAFISRSVDRARLAYAYEPVSRPRQLIFIGTTNDDQYLRDTTGNRRFWPVQTGEIDLEALKTDRDQLWAEAAHIEARRSSLVLDPALWEAAAAAQEARLLDDPWADILITLQGEVEGDLRRVSTTKALEHVGVDPSRQGPFQAKRLVPIMRSLGWSGPKRLRIDGKAGVRGYERPSTDEIPEEPDPGY